MRLTWSHYEHHGGRELEWVRVQQKPFGGEFLRARVREPRNHWLPATTKGAQESPVAHCAFFWALHWNLRARWRTCTMLVVVVVVHIGPTGKAYTTLLFFKSSLRNFQTKNSSHGIAQRFDKGGKIFLHFKYYSSVVCLTHKKCGLGSRQKRVLWDVLEMV